MIGKGWKLAALLVLVGMMTFVVWELRDFGEPNGDPVEDDQGWTEVDEDGGPSIHLGIDNNRNPRVMVMNGSDVYEEDSSGYVTVWSEKDNRTYNVSRTIMDDMFLLGTQSENTSANNAVTAVVFDYRGFDTLGEATVLFAAVSGVLITIRAAFPKKGKEPAGKKDTKGGGGR